MNHVSKSWEPILQVQSPNVDKAYRVNLPKWCKIAFINSTKQPSSNVFNRTFPGKFHLIQQLKKGFKAEISHLEAKKKCPEISQSKKKYHLPHMSCSWIHIRITYIKLYIYKYIYYMCQTNHFLIQHYPNIILCNGSFFFLYIIVRKSLLVTKWTNSWHEKGIHPTKKAENLQKGKVGNNT